MMVMIRRQWNHWAIASCSLEDLTGFHWNDMPPNTAHRSPHAMVHAYIHCDRIVGEIAHSHLHGPSPHKIRVVVVAKDNSRAVMEWVKSRAGPRPVKA